MSWNLRYRVREHLRTSLWPIPCAFGLLGLVVGMSLWRLDLWTGWKLLGFEHQGAMSLLSAIVGATLTFLGTAFSVLLVVVQFASTQLTPRAIHVSLNDPLYRVTVGLFVGTFVFSLIILARTHSDFVPQLALVLASTLVVLSITAYVCLISHLRLSLRPVIVAARIGRMGRRTITQLYPRALAASNPETPDRDDGAIPVATRVIMNAGPPGILVAYDAGGIIAEARRCDARVILVPGPGDFVRGGAPLFRLSEPAGKMRDSLLLDSLVLAQERSPDQDPAFVFRILVDVAVKALSPSINDPTSAVMVIDQLHDLLACLSSRQLDVGRHRDGERRLRLSVDLPTWDDYVSLAIDEIRQFGVGQLQIARRLRALLEDLLHTVPPERRLPVERELALLTRSVERTFADRDDLECAKVADAQGIGSSPKTS
jgi:uncharacterized membrane protein